MKLALLFLLFTTQLAFGNNGSVTTEVDGLPANIEDFIELRDSLRSTPEGAATLMVVAMLALENNSNLGKMMMVSIMSETNLKNSNGDSSYEGKELNISYSFHIPRLVQRPDIARSYVLGTVPKNKYKLPETPYQFDFTRNSYSEPAVGTIKLFIKSSGADSRRPITLKEHDEGYYEVHNPFSLFLGVKSK